MKIFVTIFAFMITTMNAAAQDSWRISLNKMTVLVSSESNELINIKKIKPTDWKKNGYLEIIYKEADTGFWKRSFQFDDESGNQLFSKENTTNVKIPLSVLRKIFAGKKEVKIYTVASPVNPDIAIRMQRVHLCTLKLR